MSNPSRADRQTVASLRPNQSLSEVYLLNSCELRSARNGSLYLQMKLTDRSGTIEGRLWNASQAMGKALDGAQYVYVKGRVETYQGRLQVVADGIKPVEPDNVLLDDFLPHTAQDVDELYARLERAAGTVTQPQLAVLLKAFLDDEEIARGFRRCPAAVSFHQPYLGGLLEHTVNVVELAELVCDRYESLNRDLLVTSAVLHDVGKIRELTYNGPFGYSDQGKLVGHLVIGVMMIQEKLEAMSDFPDDLRDVLFHMILSHHGEHEWGSPKLPMTPEALVLHHLDNLDAKVEASSREIETDPMSKSHWTGFSRMFKRELYKGLARDSEAD